MIIRITKITNIHLLSFASGVPNKFKFFPKKKDNLRVCFSTDNVYNTRIIITRTLKEIEACDLQRMKKRRSWTDFDF